MGGTYVSDENSSSGGGGTTYTAGTGINIGGRGNDTISVNTAVVPLKTGAQTFAGPLTGSSGLDCGNRRLANFCNRQSSNVTTSGGYTTDTIDTYTPTIASGAIGAVGCRFFGIDSLHNFSSAGVCDAKIYVTCPAAGDLRQIGTPVYDNALQSGSVPSLSCSAGSIVAKMSTYFTSSVACQWFFNNAVNLF